MSSLFTGKFWTATVERGVKTAAQSAIAILVADGTGLLDTDWVGVGSVVGMATLLSVLTSVGSSEIGGPGPSLGDAEELPVQEVGGEEDVHIAE